MFQRLALSSHEVENGLKGVTALCNVGLCQGASVTLSNALLESDTKNMQF